MVEGHMKIAIIGSTSYQNKMQVLKRNLELANVGMVRLPAFDSHPEFDELQVCEYNRRIIEWADVVYVIWDQRSLGTVFDFGMCFALRKPIIVYYLEPKTLAGVMKKYATSTLRLLQQPDESRKDKGYEKNRPSINLPK